ncbi:hypothetical protein PRIPAC_77018 [Pristionchus pacificus]|uniref:GDT1 family protein n=1 Tax=Pristionchus pacificus TaxID=54126 RepID=A0A2A6CLG1_PRIPA|nr:hypothetical protein PRIPAC_77018 [Pristionchus pacificus]|eukprot:PDM78956.1 hypothetical protein PRIPAC_31535 [Pristionchus pacificus]
MDRNDNSTPTVPYTTEPSMIEQSFLNGALSSLTMIVTSELLDKSFFIAVVMAMRYPRMFVYCGVMSALSVMTVLSATAGLLTAFIPRRITVYASSALMLLFGLKIHTSVRSLLKIVAETFTLTFVAEWGDRSQLATVMLAATDNFLGVIIGGVAGHAVCSGAAVLGGRCIANHVSVRIVTVIGGFVFLIFAVLSIVMYNINPSA